MVDGDLGYGAYWMRWYRMAKELEIPTLVWCRIDVKCATVSRLGFVGCRKGMFFMVEVTNGFFLGVYAIVDG